METLPGIADCHRLRVRSGGPQVFVDMHVAFTGDHSLAELQGRMAEIEKIVRKICPNADVTVHPEPILAKKEAAHEGKK